MVISSISFDEFVSTLLISSVLCWVSLSPAEFHFNVFLFPLLDCRIPSSSAEIFRPLMSRIYNITLDCAAEFLPFVPNSFFVCWFPHPSAEFLPPLLNPSIPCWIPPFSAEFRPPLLSCCLASSEFRPRFCVKGIYVSHYCLICASSSHRLAGSWADTTAITSLTAINIFPSQVLRYLGGFLIGVSSFLFRNCQLWGFLIGVSFSLFS